MLLEKGSHKSAGSLEAAELALQKAQLTDREAERGLTGYVRAANKCLNGRVGPKKGSVYRQTG